MTAPAEKKDNRWIIILLVVIFAAPFAGSWLLFNFTGLGKGGAGAASHGTLIQPPRPLADVVLVDPAQPQAAPRLHGKWTLVTVISGVCEGPCEALLYTMRQIRLAMSRNSHRVQRLLLSRAPLDEILSAPQRRQYAGQLLAPTAALRTTAGASALPLLDGDQAEDNGRMYIIDPLGNLMMSYPAGTPPKGIIQDLKRLLRYSRIG